MPHPRLSALATPLAAALGVLAAVLTAPVSAEPVRIGELNSYTTLPAFTEPYRKGWELALKEINATGGVLGEDLEVISRDDAGRPEDAVRIAGELLDRDGADLLMGTFFSHVGLAVSDLARQRGVVFLAAEPLTDALVWSKGNTFTFRLRPSTYMQASMLAEEAAKLPARRWATVAPNYEYGQSAVENFRKLLRERRPDVEFVAEQWPAQGKIEAGPTAQALLAARPEAIFNVTFGADLAKFVREGTVRGLFDDTAVVSMLTGEPEYLLPMGAEAPEGWIVTGYPVSEVDSTEHARFRLAYRADFGEEPRLGSVVGYAALKAAAAAIEKAGSTEPQALIAAFRGLELGSPFGPITFRAADHQSTMGAFVGRTAVRDGAGVMVDWRYADGAAYLPSEEEAARLRPAE